MGKLIYREATEEDSAALCRLLRKTPMGQGIRVSQDRGADFFSGSRRREEPLRFGEHLMRIRGRLSDCFPRGLDRFFIDGGIRKVRYLSDLRIHTDHRSGLMLARGYRLLRKHVFDKGEWAQTIVLKDNAGAEELLTSGRAGLPEYRPCGSYQTWFMNGQHIAIKRDDLKIRDAVDEDSGAMRSLLETEGPSAAFTPWVDFSKAQLTEYRVARYHGELVGMIRVRASGETQIDGYGAGMRILRPIYNRWATLRNLPALPAAGQTFAPLAIGGVICKDRDPKILQSLIADVLQESRLYAIGLDVSDPLAEALVGIRAYRTFAHHYQVGFSGEPYSATGPFAFDYSCV